MQAIVQNNQNGYIAKYFDMFHVKRDIYAQSMHIIMQFIVHFVMQFIVDN